MSDDSAVLIVAALYLCSGLVTVCTLLAIYCRARSRSATAARMRETRRGIDSDHQKAIFGLDPFSEEFKKAEALTQQRYKDEKVPRLTAGHVGEVIATSAEGNPLAAVEIAKQDLVFVSLSAVLATAASIWSLYL